MTLMKWDPFRDVQSLQHAVNRLFEDNMTRRFDRSYGGDWGAADIYETADNVLVYADVPGVQQDDVKVQVLGNQLIIEGERKQGGPAENAQKLSLERPYGKFQRVFNLGISVNQNAIKAILRNGVLEVVLPKSDESKPKEVQISIEE